MADALRLAALLAEVGADLAGEADEARAFTRVAVGAVDVVPGCDQAGVAVRRRRGRTETVASTADGAAELDRVEATLGEGPGRDAAFESGRTLVPDVAREERWPAWAREAAERGVRSALCLRLSVNGEVLGTLNLYARRSEAFAGTVGEVAGLYAAHAAVALSNAKAVSGLTAALESRHLIGMAQGVLAQRYDIGFDRAFDVLHRYSNDTNTKLRDVAQLVLERRSLPELEG
jgi:GAF domain-containing protein